MAALAVSERLFQISQEIQEIENELGQRRFALRAFLRHLRPASPAVVGDRMRAANENIMRLETRLQMLRDEQRALIVQAVTLGDRRD